MSSTKECYIVIVENPNGSYNSVLNNCLHSDYDAVKADIIKAISCDKKQPYVYKYKIVRLQSKLEI